MATDRAQNSQKYHVVGHLENFPETERLPGVMVPQRVFVTRARGPASHPNATRMQTIRFRGVNGSLGVRLQDVLDPQAIQTVVRGAGTIPALSNTGTRVSICICWPGYEVWRKENAVRIFDETRDANPFALGQIAHQIARVVQQFYTEMGNNSCGEQGWGLNTRPFGKLYLVELRQVLQASWQPVFCIDV